MPRKTVWSSVWISVYPLASMRPRPDAAENAVRLVAPHVGARAASMRPRPDAAENLALAGPQADVFTELQ